jgi:hypothetical protein
MVKIGDWVTRERYGSPHYVESLVAGDVVTRCGRRMTNEPTKTGGRLVMARLGAIELSACSQCAR